MRTMLLTEVTKQGPGQLLDQTQDTKTLQATVTGTGAVSATVVFEASNDGGRGFVTLGTVTLSGTNVASDGFVSDAPWDAIRANVTALSAGAAVTASMGG